MKNETHGIESRGLDRLASDLGCSREAASEIMAALREPPPVSIGPSGIGGEYQSDHAGRRLPAEDEPALPDDERQSIAACLRLNRPDLLYRLVELLISRAYWRGRRDHGAASLRGDDR